MAQAARGRRPLLPRILVFAGMTVAMIAATVRDAPGLLLGLAGLGWVVALFALVHATQAGGDATLDSGATGGDGAPDSDGDGGGE